MSTRSAVSIHKNNEQTTFSVMFWQNVNYVLLSRSPHVNFASMKNKPLILISNDDGITAPGIRVLVDCMKKLGKVVVVAPDSPQSGMGHAITINESLRLDKSDYFGDEVLAYQCSGTPADCVKLALDKVLDRRPDLLVSGINHGSNSSVNVIYSGNDVGSNGRCY